MQLQTVCYEYVARKFSVFIKLEQSFTYNRINFYISLFRSLRQDATWAISDKNFYIKWNKNCRTLTMLFLDKVMVGSGFWKKFFASNTLRIPLSSEQNEAEQFKSVWLEVDDKVIDEIKIQEYLYKRFVTEAPSGVYFLEPLEEIYKNIYTQRRLVSPLNEPKFNDPVQKAYCMRDIAKSLAWIHRQGMVHGDVYLKNILVEERVDVKGSLRLVPYLTDFGSTTTWGIDKYRKLDDYVRWDPCKCYANVNTPLMDWHGFTITNIVAWFPEMASYLKWEKFISTRQMVFNDEISGNFVSDESYWVNDIPFSKLSFMEQRAWHIFIALCRKSSQLYLYFKNKLNEITKDDVENGMIEVKASEIIKECIEFADEMCREVSSAAWM